MSTRPASRVSVETREDCKGFALIPKHLQQPLKGRHAVRIGLVQNVPCMQLQQMQLHFWSASSRSGYERVKQNLILMTAIPKVLLFCRLLAEKNGQG